MTRVTVLREDSEAPDASYRAVGGHVQATGRTAGEAVDALTAQLPDDEAGTLILVRALRPDRFFSAEQRRRLTELMDRWRSARHSGQSLPDEEQAELQRLVDAEIEATSERAAAAWREIPK